MLDLRSPSQDLWPLVLPYVNRPDACSAGIVPCILFVDSLEHRASFKLTLVCLNRQERIVVLRCFGHCCD